MKALWGSLLGLGLLWFVVAAAVDSPAPADRPATAGSPEYRVPDPPPGSQEQLTERAKALAIGRVPSGATLTPVSSKPRYFKGDTLTPASATDPTAVAGYEIVFEATLAGKPISRITVHAAPSDRVVFVKQEQVP